MKNSPDITFTLLGDDFDAYRLTAQTLRGQEFVGVYFPGDAKERTWRATEQRSMTDKAERCGLAVRIE